MVDNERLFLRSGQAGEVTGPGDRHRQVLGRVNGRLETIDGMLGDCRKALEKEPPRDVLLVRTLREMEMKRVSVSYRETAEDRANDSRQWYRIGVEFDTNRPVYVKRGEMTDKGYVSNINKELI